MCIMTVSQTLLYTQAIPYLYSNRGGYDCPVCVVNNMSMLGYVHACQVVIIFVFYRWPSPRYMIINHLKSIQALLLRWNNMLCVCVCECMYDNVCVFVSVCMTMCVFVSVCMTMCVFVCECMYDNVFVSVCMTMCAYMRVTFMCVCKSVCMNVLTFTVYS